MKLSHGIVYRLDGQYRRSCWLLVACSVVMFFVARWMDAINPAPNRPDGCWLILALAMLPGAILTCRLRMNDQGLVQEFLCRETAWNWEDIASGRIRKHGFWTLIDPARKWWGRRLRLEYLPDADGREVLAAINLVYQLPPPPETPDQLNLRVGFRKQVRLSSRGLEIHSAQQLRQVAWEQVDAVVFLRSDPVRRDFQRLIIGFRPDELVLRTHQNSPCWSGATAEQISVLVGRHVDESKTWLWIHGERPPRQKDIETESTKVLSNAIQLWWLGLIGTVGMLIALVCLGVGNGWLQALLMSPSALIGAVPFWLAHDKWKEHAKLLGWLRDVDSDEESGNGQAKTTRLP